MFDVAAGSTPSGIDLDLQAVVSGGFVTKSGSGVLNLSGNNTFAAGLYINAGVVRLDNAGALNSSTPNAVTFNPGSTGTLRLNGNSVTISGLSTDATTPGSPVIQNGGNTPATLTVNISSDCTYAGVLQDGSDNGSLSITKTGSGTLTLAGSSANVYDGTTTVNAGTLVLNKPSGTHAIFTSLVIGDGSGGANADVVRLMANNQMNVIDVTINSSGLLDLNGFTNTVGPITLTGGNITTGTGALNTSGAQITSQASSVTAAISGNWNMGAGAFVNVASGTTPSGIDLDVSAVISGVELFKTGNGVLNLSGNNTFTGGLEIDAGVVQLANAGALNSTTPNVVAFYTPNTGTLRLNGNSVTVSAISTNAPGTPTIENASGTAATLTVNNASDCTYAGVIHNGAGGGALSLTKIGAGMLVLSGSAANTATGATTVNAAGTLALNKSGGVNAIGGNLVVGNATDTAQSSVVKLLASNQIADTSSVSVNQSGLLNLNGNSDATGAVTLTGGAVSLGSGTLTVAGTMIVNSGATTTAKVTGSGLLNLTSLTLIDNLVRSGGGVTRLTGSIGFNSGKSLDLSDTRLIDTVATLGTWNGTTYTNFTGLIRAGRNGGAWNGTTAIITSQSNALGVSPLTTLAIAKAGDINKTTLGGIGLATTDILVMYTYAGDVNLDGKINGDDYFRIDQGFSGHLTGYENGDLNYDGRVDADDYFIIDRNYVKQGGNIFASGEPVMGDGTAIDSMGGVAADSTGSLQAVPEPGVMGVVLLGMGIGSRRRKRQG